jgi:AAA family ATP:ADP antiporter
LAAVIAFTAIALWPTLFALVAAQSIRRASEYAIARPGREVLFTVVSREAKYKAKSVIETVVYRGGDALGGWLFALVAAAGAGIAGLALLSLPLAAVSVWLSAWLARRQETLAASQEAGRSTSAPAEPAPATAAENRGM